MGANFHCVADIQILVLLVGIAVPSKGVVSCCLLKACPTVYRSPLEL